MNFLSPWFLLGAALIAGPILAHLIRRATRQRVSFSAMRFLQASPPKLDRKNRIQHPLAAVAALFDCPGPRPGLCPALFQT